MNTKNTLAIAQLIAMISIASVIAPVAAFAETTDATPVIQSTNGSTGVDRTVSLDEKKAELTNKVNAAINRSEALKNKITNNGALYGDLTATIVAEIDADIANLNEVKAEIAQAQTLDELKTIIEELKTHGRDVAQAKVRRLLLLAQIARIEMRTIARTDGRITKVAERVEAAKNAGKDVAALEALLEDAREQLAAAKNDLSSLKADVTAQDVIDAARIKEVRSTLQSVKEQLKSVYGILKDVVTQLKAL